MWDCSYLYIRVIFWPKLYGPLHPVCLLFIGLLALSPSHTPLLKEMLTTKLQVDLGDPSGSVPDHCNRASIVLPTIIASQPGRISVREGRACHLIGFKSYYNLNERALKVYL